MTGGRGDDGYAMLAAVAAIAVFSTLAMAVAGQMQSSITQASAEIERAKADGAAEAGIQLAIHNLVGTERALRWSLDGRPRDMTFAGNRLVVRALDQSSKIPLLALEEEQVRRLFALLDVPAGRLDEVTDSYLDWTDDDDEPRPNGAEFAYYARRNLHPQNGPLQSFDELNLVRGFDPALVAKVRSAATLHFGSGTFNARGAEPIAIAVMTPGGENSPEALERERELRGQRAAIELGEENLAGKTVEILAEARTPAGGRAVARQLIELTGNPSRPFAVIEAD